MNLSVRTIDLESVGLRLATTVVLTAGIIGCQETYPVQIDSSYGPGIKLDGVGTTFAWVTPIEESKREFRAENPSFHALIQRAVEEQLVIKGYKKGSTDSCDFWIDYHITRNIRGDEWVPYKNEWGALFLYVVDPAKRQRLWRATAKTRVGEAASPEARVERIRDAIRRMLKRFPSNR